eukprot:s2511_g5.t1
MRCAAGQAHWQNGIAERYGGSWKAIWDKLNEEYSILDDEIYEAACAVSEARNTLRNRSGFSPRQWVFGSQGRLGANLDDEPHDLASLSHITSDEKMGRKHQIKLGAKMAFFHCQNKDNVHRALNHRSRVQPRDFKPGDMVYVYREGKGRSKRPSSKWLGPATVIGPEGSNYWVARGGRCLLAAAEHLRMAEHEEVSEALRIKAALLQVRKSLDADFEEEVDDQAEVVEKQDLPEAGEIAMEAESEDVEDLLDMEVEAGGAASSSSVVRRPTVDHKKVADAEKREQQLNKLFKQRRSLDDVPTSVRKTIKKKQNAMETHLVEEVYVSRHGQSAEAMEKALEKEIPWNLIPPEEKQLFQQAEATQWEEHIKFGAVKPLSVEESREVEETYGKERILSSRFLYRDKNLAKRRSDSSVPCKPKARLCVGGQRDPDLGVLDMSVDAPTINRHSILLGILVALSSGWKISIGDIRAAFLNGVPSTRRLFFRQPVRGIPSLRPGQLIEILKGVFGLATSPKQWWLKLSSELLTINIFHEDHLYIIEQNEIDPCAFRILREHDHTVQEAIAYKFPVDEWEATEFEYVGCEYRVSEEEVLITQTNYVETRLNKIPIPRDCKEDEEASEELINQHRSVVGCLSWLAKQTRPDIQFSVAQAQRVQGKPTIKHIKDVNKIVDQAKKFKYQGVKIKRIPKEDMVILAYHDAAWANAELEGGAEHDMAWDGNFKLGSQLASLVMVGDRKCLRNEDGNFSILDWRSHGSTRVCRSTFAGETMACGEALESALFLRSLLLSFLKGTMISESEAGKYMGLHLMTDCKSLFDHLHKEGVPRAPSERRMQGVELLEAPCGPAEDFWRCVDETCDRTHLHQNRPK